MQLQTVLASRSFWLGVIGLAGMFLGGATICKAQEVNPAQFTDTGVVDAYPAKKAPAKRPRRTLTAARTHTNRTSSSRALARKRKAHGPVGKRDEVYKPNI